MSDDKDGTLNRPATLLDLVYPGIR